MIYEANVKSLTHSFVLLDHKLQLRGLGSSRLLLNVNVPLVQKVAKDKHEDTRADGPYREVGLRMELRVHKAREGCGPLQPVVLIWAHSYRTLTSLQKLRQIPRPINLFRKSACCPKTTNETRQNPPNSKIWELFPKKYVSVIESSSFQYQQDPTLSH